MNRQSFGNAKKYEFQKSIGHNEQRKKEAINKEANFENEFTWQVGALYPASVSGDICLLSSRSRGPVDTDSQD